jgi:dTDP-4-dehydrorhamnose 3,5-epimerase
MKFSETSLKGAYIIEPDLKADERGFFARTFCSKEFKNHGLSEFVQCNISFNKTKGTLRGMHYQVSPCPEAKLVRCTMGAIYDVIIDLRSNSSTFKKWTAIELTALNRKMIYVPEGFAHGFITLEDNSEVFYQMGEFFSPEHARGVRWNDPAFNIQWPFKATQMSLKDEQYADFVS